MRRSFKPPLRLGRAYRAFAGLAVVAFLLGLAYATRTVDSPAGIVTWSEAFVTDEGFHSKWAQNAVRFGSFGAPYDFSFVPAGILHNAATLLVFRTFGASYEVLRVYAGFLAAVGLVLYWILLRSAPPPFPRWQALFLLIVTVNYPAYARVLFIEPIGIVFSLLALILAFRERAGWIACAASIVLAFCAFLSKIHFLDVTCTVAAVWALRLTLWREPDAGRMRSQRIAFVCSTLGMLLVTGALFWTLRDSVGEFASTTREQFPGRPGASYPLELLSSELQVLTDLPQNTHHAAFFASLLIAVALLVGDRRWRKFAAWGKTTDRAAWFAAQVANLRKAKLDVAMALWMALGLLLRGSRSSYQPPRYFYPLLIPLSYFAVRLLCQVPKRQRGVAFVGVLLFHAYVQSPFYYSWLYRPDISSQYANRLSFTHEVEAQAPSGTIVLLGDDAAAYALFSNRIRPIEVEYLPSRYTLCDRIAYWHPRFYAGAGADDPTPAKLRQCPGVGAVSEVKRERVFYGTWGERILYAIEQSR